MSRDATIFGLPQGNITWNPDFKASLDDKGLWTGSNSFTCRLHNLTQLIPDLGASCQEPGFDFMYMIGADVSNNEGDTAVVSCRYSGTVSPDYEFDGDNPNLKKTFSMAISVSEEPIETHPRYDELTADQRNIVQQFKAGRYKIYKTVDGVITKVISRVDDLNVGSFDIAASEPLTDLVTKINKGFISYLVPNQVFRVSYTQNSKPPAALLNMTGYIKNAEDAPTVGDGRNWLLIGVNYSSESGVYSITEEYQLSGPGGWNTEIYTKPT